MKKNIYLVFALLSFSPSMATQNVTTSFIIASSLVLSKTSKKRTFDKKLSLDLHYAVEKNDYVAAQKLINNPKVDVNAKVDYGTKLWQKGWTPLIWCCRRGDQSFKIVKALLARGDIKVNLASNNGNWTPLIVCSGIGDEAFRIAVALLSRRDIKVNVHNTCGTTPLILGCIAGDQSFKIIVALLTYQDIEVNLKDKDGYTPLDSIINCIKGNKENYTYVKVWNMLVAKGGILNECKNDYQNLNSQGLKEPDRTYVHLIKQRPPNNCTNNHFMYSEEETKEDT